MRKVVAATFVSLDGVMQAPGGPEEDIAGGFEHGGWTFPYFDDIVGEVMGEAFTNSFDLLLGRKTYDIFASHWPALVGDPMADVFNACTKYVATRSDTDFTWQNTVALRGDVAAEVERLKAGEGRQLMIQGSSELIQTLLAQDLIDDFTLLIFPVLLGKGKRLFGDGVTPGAMKLVSSKSSGTGVVIARYVKDGPVQTGSFALEDPTADEVARREAVKQEA